MRVLWCTVALVLMLPGQVASGATSSDSRDSAEIYFEGNYFVVGQVEALECDAWVEGAPDYVLIHQCWVQFGEGTKYAEVAQAVPMRGNRTAVATIDDDGRFVWPIYQVCAEVSAFWTEDEVILTETLCHLKGWGP